MEHVEAVAAMKAQARLGVQGGMGEPLEREHERQYRLGHRSHAPAARAASRSISHSKTKCRSGFSDSLSGKRLPPPSTTTSFAIRRGEFGEYVFAHQANEMSSIPSAANKLASAA